VVHVVALVIAFGTLVRLTVGVSVRRQVTCRIGGSVTPLSTCTKTLDLATGAGAGLVYL